MNGTIKFHKPTSPAFNVGEVWFGGPLNSKITIVSVEKVGSEKWDYTVTFQYANGTIYSSNAWKFQTRYTHHADKYAKCKN